MQDVSIYENGKQRVLVGQIPLQDLWSTHYDYDIYSQFYICHTNHNHDWGSAGTSSADQKIYLCVAPPFGALGTNRWQVTYGEIYDSYLAEKDSLPVAVYYPDYEESEKYVYYYPNMGTGNEGHFVVFNYFGYHTGSSNVGGQGSQYD